MSKDTYLSFGLREKHESTDCSLWSIWILFLLLFFLLCIIFITSFFPIYWCLWRRGLLFRLLLCRFLNSQEIDVMNLVHIIPSLTGNIKILKIKIKFFTSSLPRSLSSDSPSPESSVGDPSSSLSATKSSSWKCHKIR